MSPTPLLPTFRVVIPHPCHTECHLKSMGAVAFARAPRLGPGCACLRCAPFPAPTAGEEVVPPPYGGAGGSRFHVVPETLLGVLWLQFALAVADHKRYARSGCQRT